MLIKFNYKMLKTKYLLAFKCTDVVFIMLINIKMSTNVGILTFISMIIATYESLEVKQVFIFQLYSFYEQLKYQVQLS